MEFRAQTIRDFVADLARTVRAVKPQIVLGTYVGSWYPGYYEVGVNWGSPKNGLRYSWYTPNYPRTGYAQFFDWISTGCYYPNAMEDEARMQGQNPQATVEFAAALSNQAVASGAFVYAGIYLQDYTHRPEAFLRALEACTQRSQGWMIFDLSFMDDREPVAVSRKSLSDQRDQRPTICRACCLPPARGSTAPNSLTARQTL